MASSQTILLCWKVLHFGIVPPTAFLSIVANVVLMYAMRRAGKWDTTTTTFFVLTVSDVMQAFFSIFGLVTRVIMFLDRDALDRMYPIMMPVFYLYVYPLPLYFSKALLAIMSIERFVALRYRLNLHQIWTKGRVVVMMITSTILIVLLGIPKILHISTYINKNDTSITAAFVVMSSHSSAALTHALFVLVFEILPLVIICTASVMVVVMLRQRVYTKKKVANISYNGSTGESERVKIPTISNNSYLNTEKTNGGSLVNPPQLSNNIDVSCSTSSSADTSTDIQATLRKLRGACTSGSNNPPIQRLLIRPFRQQKMILQTRVTVTMLMIALISVCLYIPGKILSLLFTDTSKTRIEFVLMDFCIGMMYFMELVNSVTNSVTFVARSTKYKKVVKSIFK